MKTTHEFRKELYAKYGKRLIIPDDAVYLGNKKDIKVICPKHGEKWMRPNNLLSGAKCRDCGYEVVSVKNSDTPQEFLEKAHKRHGDKYEYPNIFEEYGKVKKIHILCKKCGKVFEQLASEHIYGRGCSYCNPFPKRYTVEDVRRKIHETHPNIELISDYNGDNDSKIMVRCNIHGNEWETTLHRLEGQKYACAECYRDDRANNIREIYSEKFQRFIEERYAQSYDISQVRYINLYTPVKLACPTHGEFCLKPTKMLNRLDGCPYCSESHLERETRNVLDKLDVEYNREKTFDWLRNKGNMFLDFYLPQYNVAIECQGTQHIDGRDDSIMSKKLSFEERVDMDKLKNQLCLENNIPIIYIFNKDKSSRRLDEQFNHMYDDSLFIEDIIDENEILMNKISEAH